MVKYIFNQLLSNAVHVYCVVLLCFVSANSWGKAEPEPVSFPAAKSHYIVEMIKQVYWPNESQFTQFSIGVVGDDTELIAAFNTRFSGVKVRQRSLFMTPVKVKEVAKNYQLIYVHSSELSSIEKINQAFPDALIITDGAVSNRHHQISFISSFENIKIKFNLDNLHARNFIVSNNLLFFAGNKSDLEKQLKVKDNLLSNMFSDIQSKEDALKKVQLTLNRNNLELASLVNELEQKKAALSRVKNEKRNIANEIEHSQNNLLQLKQKMQLKLNEHEALMNIKQQAHNTLIVLQEELLKKVQFNQQKLIAQETDVKLQEAKIHQQMKVIGKQKLLLYFFFVIIFIVLLLALSLWHLNKLRKLANSKLQTLNDKLYETATIDSMTGLFNRRHFIESTQLQLAQLKRTKFKCSVLMMDIDFFKKVNDNYGHAMGDAAITAVAKVFKSNLRTYDTVGRLGGEEYGMFLSNCEANRALEVAERLREEIERMDISFDGEVINITISIGVTLVSASDDDIHAILQRADQALYKAKNMGRNRVEFFEENSSI